MNWISLNASEATLSSISFSYLPMFNLSMSYVLCPYLPILSNSNPLIDLFMKFSALNKPVPLAWRALLSDEISCKISIIKARSLRKFLLQEREAIPENFVLRKCEISV